MRARHFALTAVLAVLLSGCSAVTGVGDGIVDSVNRESDIITKTDVSNAKIAIIAYGTDQPGAFPSNVSELEKWGYTPTEGLQPVTFSGDAMAFCVQGVAESGSVFHATESSSIEDGPCP